MSGGITAAVVFGGAALGAYGARQGRKGAEAAARGSQAIPWGETGRYMDELLRGAMGRFEGGDFRFGPDPDIYNAYLGFGRGLGLNLPKGLNRTQQDVTGYGPGAYEWMLNLVQGPAWAGARRTNPSAMIGAPNMATGALSGALGGLTTAYGLGLGQQNTATPAQGYQSVTNPYYWYGG